MSRLPNDVTVCIVLNPRNNILTIKLTMLVHSLNFRMWQMMWQRHQSNLNMWGQNQLKRSRSPFQMKLREILFP